MIYFLRMAFSQQMKLVRHQTPDVYPLIGFLARLHAGHRRTVTGSRFVPILETPF